MQKKLAVLMSADVVEFGRLVSADEHGAIEQLIACRTAILNVVGKLGGKPFNETADGVLAELPGPVEAVRCAVLAQNALGKLSRERPENCRMRFKIGLAMGEVVEVDGDLIGIGVTMALKLQSLAPAGGIAVCAAVRDKASSVLPFGYQPAGEHELKAGLDAVPVFILTAAAENQGSTARAAAVAAKSSRPASRTIPMIPSPKLLLGTAGAALAILAAGSLWLFDAVPGIDKPFAAARAKPAIVAVAAVTIEQQALLAELPPPDLPPEERLGFENLAPVSEDSVPALPIEKSAPILAPTESEPVKVVVPSTELDPAVKAAIAMLKSGVGQIPPPAPRMEKAGKSGKLNKRSRAVADSDLSLAWPAAATRVLNCGRGCANEAMLRQIGSIASDD